MMPPAWTMRTFCGDAYSRGGSVSGNASLLTRYLETGVSRSSESWGLTWLYSVRKVSNAFWQCWRLAQFVPRSRS